MLHVVNKSPLERSALDSCLRVARGGSLLLIEDAVYAACRGNAAASRLASAAERLKIYVLQPDLEARGVGSDLVEGVTAVDYEGFVDLVVSHEASHSWL